MLQLLGDHRPVAELVADEDQNGPPDRSADERLEKESGQWHPRDTGWNGDDVADDGQEPSDEDGRLAMSREIGLGALDILATDTDELAVLEQQRLAAGLADPVAAARAKQGCDTVDDQDHRQAELT